MRELSEEQIFLQAIEIDDPAARAAFLDQQCGDDAALRQSLQALLDCHDTADGLLDTPAVARPETVVEQPGTVFDHYELVEQIGEGGFGVVFRAEQREPVRRSVAIKIIRPQRDSQQVVSRFEAERQTLAMMNHPHIATVFDAGTTPSGRPYFVMELVDGPTIDRYCDEQRLTIPDRLALLIDVCHAVQHAHQKGIIHRDLKPSNVLVHVDEGRPVPKVIDFGIAQAVRSDEQVDDEPDNRSRSPRAGTPGYMSPELLTGDGDIDTRADVYALGGLLHRLLAGCDAVEVDRSTDLVRMRQLICDIDVVPLWVRLEQSGDELPQLAMLRSTTTTGLMRAASRELDWITRKALSRDRSDRYESASELARDIERAQSFEPVLAAPPSRFYRLRTIARRHRFGLAAVASIIAALTAGVIVATLGLVEANQQRQIADNRRVEADRHRRIAEEQTRAAERERRQAVVEKTKAEQAVTLMEQIASAAHPDHGRPPDYTVRQLMDDLAMSLEEIDDLQPDVESRLRRTIGRAYWHLGDMQRAGPQLDRALELRRDQYGNSHPLVAQSLVDHALYLTSVSQIPEAEREVADALKTLRGCNANDDLILALHVEARLRRIHEDRDAVEPLFAEAWSISKQLHGESDPRSLVLQARVAFAKHRTIGMRRKAVQFVRDALDRLIEQRPEPHADIALIRRWLGTMLADRGNHEEAESLIRKALADHKTLFGDRNEHVVQDLFRLIELLLATGRRDEAEATARDAVEMAEHVAVEQNWLRARAYQSLATILQSSKPAEAAEVWRQAAECSRKIGAPMPVARQLHRRAVALKRIDKNVEAIACYRQSLQALDQVDAPEFTVNVLVELAELLKVSGDCANAVDRLKSAARLTETMDAEVAPLRVRLVELLTQLGAGDAARHLVDVMQVAASESESAAVAHQLARALLLIADEDLTTAESTLRDAIDRYQSVAGGRAMLHVRTVLGQCLTQQKSFEEAEQVLLRTHRYAVRTGGFRQSDMRRVVQALVDLYDAWQRPVKAGRWRSRPVLTGDDIAE